MADTTPEKDSTLDPQNEHSQQWQQKRARRAEMEANNPLQETQDGPKLFEVQPDDGALVRFFKRIGRMGQVVFGLLLALFIAVVTFAAG
jgi:hypothetical protein